MTHFYFVIANDINARVCVCRPQSCTHSIHTHAHDALANTENVRKTRRRREMQTKQHETRWNEMKRNEAAQQHDSNNNNKRRKSTTNFCEMWNYKTKAATNTSNSNKSNNCLIKMLNKRYKIIKFNKQQPQKTISCCCLYLLFFCHSVLFVCFRFNFSNWKFQLGTLEGHLEINAHF